VTKKWTCDFREMSEKISKKMYADLEIFVHVVECMRNPTTFCLAYDFFHTVCKLS